VTPFYSQEGDRSTAAVGGNASVSLKDLLPFVIVDIQRIENWI